MTRRDASLQAELASSAHQDARCSVTATRTQSSPTTTDAQPAQDPSLPLPIARLWTCLRLLTLLHRRHCTPGRRNHKNNSFDPVESPVSEALEHQQRPQ
jgi:hypothetical protein